MDYEFRIMLEKELAHAREIQALLGGRLDTHDTSFEHVKDALVAPSERFDRIESILERLAGKVDSLTGKVDALVAALLPRAS